MPGDQSGEIILFSSAGLAASRVLGLFKQFPTQIQLVVIVCVMVKNVTLL